MRFLLPLLLTVFFTTKVYSQQNNPVYVDQQGVMRWTQNKQEAAFFGVNYTVPFAYGYRSHQALNVDLEKAIDQDVYHMARLGLDAFRVHVWDTEISDSLGNLLENEHLRLFDYLVFKLKERNIKVLITPIAFWLPYYPEPDQKTPGFSSKYGKRGAVTEEAALQAQERYLQQFFRHVNPYTKTTYQNDPDIIATEINNEPHHSGSKERALEYVNRMVKAVRGTGWTKPVFYNISESPTYADAVAKADIDGVSFQWYPTGLVANHTLQGNYLPHVDQYHIPFDTIPEYANKARMVYEFDSGDVLQSVMYPAMARSFRKAGFQWATQFAYDPMATAFNNTEYQTHYLNLAYTPSKAISYLIASKAFHKLPRLKNYGTYPADSIFDVFRVSYKENLSEMNAAQEFYYSNTTRTKPANASKLLHLAGVGSSQVVQYQGQGAYFLDKLENVDVQAPGTPTEEKQVDLYLNTILTPNGLKFKKVNGVYIIYKEDSSSKGKADRSSALSHIDNTLLASNRYNVAAEPFAPTLITTSQLKEKVAQEQALSGRVLDETGVGLPGVSVVLKGTGRGTTTDMNGNFKLTVPDATGTLVFSFIGYQQQEIVIGNRTTFDISMRVDAKALQEVVVVGYGTQRKEDLTGAVTAVTEEEFQRGNIVSPDQLIAGKVAGVQITPNSGAPGAGSTIRIRGGASLNASNDPLIVIDGVPLDNASISGAPNPLSMINPNDIESFNILKDASAAAIYGSRASNGVIIITTKQGRAGDKMRVSFNSLVSVSQVTNNIDVLTGDEYREAVRTYATPINQALLGEANTDWQSLIYQNAVSTDNNVSVSGSVKELPYRLSLGYLDQDGVLLTSNLKRTSAALSLNPSFLDDHLRVNINVKGSQSRSRFADEGAIGAAVSFDPTQPVYQNNQFGGYFEWVDAAGVINTLAPRNPLSVLEQRQDRSNVSRSIGNAQFDYRFHFLPDLRANLNVGYDVSRGEGTVFLPATLGSVFVQGGSDTRYEQAKTNNLLDFYLNYTKDIAAISSRVDVTGGYSYQKFNTDIPGFATLNLAGDTITRAPLQNEFTNVLIGAFARLNYALLDRYLLTVNVRRDASSRFSPDTRWGTFPSIALGWRISEEAFLRNNTFISELKLRAGYGVTGQQDIGSNYPYLPRYAYSNAEASYQFGDQFYSTLRPAGYDANIKWEETESWNTGLDFGFMDGRFSGTLDYYLRRTKDLLTEIPIPAGSNLTNRLFTNVGNIENEGVEAMLNFAAISNEKVRWDISVNGTYNRNEITNLSRVRDEASPGIQVGGIGGGVGNTIQIHSVGHPRNSFFVYRQVYDENGTPIERLYEDQNRDGSINDRDFYRYMSPDPKFFLGLSSQFSYDKFNIGFVLRGNIGNYVYNNINANAFYDNLDWNGYLLTIPSSIRNTGFVRGDVERLYSDYFVENASFLRMDNLNMGYNFGRVMNDRVNLRLTATAQNLFVITNYSGQDPEVASGIDNNFYPRPRILSLGVNVDFQ